MSDALGRFRIVSILEGSSYLILLFIAMPLKYMMDMPTPVRIVGMAHGVLFVAYAAFAIIAAVDKKWSILTLLFVGFISLVPFGAFFLEHLIRTKPERYGAV